jgi:hypothetical protein
MVKKPAVFLLVISFTLLVVDAVNWSSRILDPLSPGDIFNKITSTQFI